MRRAARHPLLAAAHTPPAAAAHLARRFRCPSPGRASGRWPGVTAAAAGRGRAGRAGPAMAARLLGRPPASWPMCYVGRLLAMTPTSCQDRGGEQEICCAPGEAPRLVCRLCVAWTMRFTSARHWPHKGGRWDKRCSSGASRGALLPAWSTRSVHSAAVATAAAPPRHPRAPATRLGITQTVRPLRLMSLGVRGAGGWRRALARRRGDIRGTALSELPLRAGVPLDFGKLDRLPVDYPFGITSSCCMPATRRRSLAPLRSPRGSRSPAEPGAW